MANKNIYDIDKKIEKNRRREIEELRRNEKKIRKIRVARFAILGVFIFLVCRISYIDIVKGEEYQRLASSQAYNAVDEKVLTARRGEILDRNGNKLAVTNMYYNVFLDNIQIKEFDDLHPDVDVYTKIPLLLNETLDIPIDEAKEYIALDSNGVPVNNNHYKVIAKDLSYSEIEGLKTELEKNEFNGVYIEEEAKRIYPYEDLAPQVIGFIRGDNGEANWGLEKSYNAYLTGTDGRSFSSYNEKGQLVRNEVEAVDGDSIVTTLDLGLQEFTDEIAQKYLEIENAQNTSIIVMKADTGEILAMSEAPGFNNNEPSNLSKIGGDNYYEYYESLDESQKGEEIYGIWRNYNVSDTYEPGSIYKPIVAATALEEGVITENDTFFCPGYKVFSDGTRVKCWHRIGHGNQTVGDALTNSCNVAMMDIAELTGRDLFYKSQIDFGFGNYTGIDLPAESKGIIRTADELNEVELGTAGMGQGFNVTPIQAITAFNAVVNGGNLYTPYVVSQIVDENGNVIKNIEPTLSKKVITEETSAIIRKDLVRVVEEGTGKNLKIDGYTIGGKTGTAEQGARNKEEYAVSFVGFIPADDPEYVAFGTINRPETYVTNQTSAVPMMREVFEHLITYYDIPPNGDVTGSNTNSSEFMEDFTGRSVDEAISYAINHGYDYEIYRSGNVVESQIPASGSIINDNTTIRFSLTDNNEEELVEVPNVIDFSVDDARSILESEGFNVVVEINETEEEIEEEEISESESEEGTSQSGEETADDEENVIKVIEQYPRNSIKLPRGSTIKIVGE